jgi:hypothetical protein
MKRDREIAVAQTMTDSLFTSVLLTSKEPTLTEYAHAFGNACQAHDFIPDQAAYQRILFDVVRDIGERQRAADKLNTVLVQSTSELLERGARRRR